MRRTGVVLALGALSFVCSPAAPALAQAAKSTRGTVTAIANDSITVKVADHDMTFSVDGKTSVQAVGAGTKMAAAVKAGQAGPKLADVIKVGQPVEVTYHDTAGTMHATRIHGVASVGDGGVAAAKSSNGTVQSVSATSLTITGSSG